MPKINTDSEYIPAEVYHADPAYSASDLKLITSTCPQVFYQSKYEQKKLEHEHGGVANGEKLDYN